MTFDFIIYKSAPGKQVQSRDLLFYLLRQKSNEDYFTIAVFSKPISDTEGIKNSTTELEFFVRRSSS